jgi:hypothetical protein
MRPERLGNLIKIVHLIGSRTRYLPKAQLFEWTDENTVIARCLILYLSKGPGWNLVRTKLLWPFIGLL